MTAPDPLDRQLLDRFQRDFPLDPRPYARIAERLGCGEAEVLDRLARLTDSGAIGRIGVTLRPNTVGASTLAALDVPPGRLEAVAAAVSAVEEVNHNYQREGSPNLWFVVTAPTRPRLDAALERIAAETGLPVLDLPMEAGYHLDLGFALWDR
ncbi:Lrp/AsnC family transcriptional regulator [Azospirillum thermophilum]|uniref:siroheme decarboxylase n=1 Tax=Azospirillum thermophilum TaxID=2202148 RepID=A0A2S2CV11_9PROT|nr:Lrp/AsnC family transcriptional regulator [Azospirillum thermophilum]AWK88210.1 AsnC family protein [Azospirillum thermophilum]